MQAGDGKQGINKCWPNRVLSMILSLENCFFFFLQFAYSYKEFSTVPGTLYFLSETIETTITMQWG